MNPKWLKIAGGLLDTAADTFANHGCNDWEWPAGFTLKEKRELVIAMEEDNMGKSYKDFTKEEKEDVETFARRGPADFALMRFLGKRLTHGGT